MKNKESFVYPNAMLHASRTKFPFRSTHKTSLMHGGLYPIQVIECAPGDTFDLNVASLIRMSNPIAPIMDNIEMHIAAYFIPLRLVFPDYEKFEGINKEGAWYDSDLYTEEVPYWFFKKAQPQGQTRDNEYSKVISGSLLDYLGASVGSTWRAIEYTGNPAISKEQTKILPTKLSCLAYHRLWDEQYRNANVSAPIFNISLINSENYWANIESVSDNADIEVGFDSDGNSLGIHKVCKFADPYTKCLPAPQRGPSVEFLPDSVPVGAFADLGGVMADEGVYFPDGVPEGEGFAPLVDAGADNPIVASFNNVTKTINDLRLLFQVQKYLEKDARYGNRDLQDKYLGHFGVRAPDATIQKTQYLGEINFRINIEQVLSTAGATDDSDTKLGQPGANSVTAGRGSLGVVSLCERGYIMIVAAARHDHTYGNGMDPYLLHHNIWDFYDPLFANIGEMPVRRALLGDVEHPEEVFGYQEPFWEYRFAPDRVSGALNPSAPNSLDYWTLSDDFSSGAPLLNEKFIYEGRDSITRALVTGDEGPDYICDFYFMHTAVREMPLFGIPGLVDHH